MAAAAEAVPRVAPPRLRLGWSDPLQGLPISFDYVARELASTLSVRVAWRPALSEYRLAPHEILVALLDSEPPDSLGSGLMRSRLGRAELIRKELRVDSASQRALWEALDAYRASVDDRALPQGSGCRRAGSARRSSETRAVWRRGGCSRIQHLWSASLNARRYSK